MLLWQQMRHEKSVEIFDSKRLLHLQAHVELVELWTVYLKWKILIPQHKNRNLNKNKRA